MESLVFVLLFSVVMIVWMGQGAQPCVSVRYVRTQPRMMFGDQVLSNFSGRPLRSVHRAVRASRYWFAHMQADRRNDSGRGRPLLHLN